MKRVLIVEDDKLIAELERDYLEANGFEADISLNGEEGLKLAMTQIYDALILDIMLPGHTGYDICKSIRQISNVPIILVTAKREDEDKIRGLGMGVDDYVVKPFSPSELVARVKSHIEIHEKLLGKGESKKVKAITIRNLKIIPDAYKAYMNDKEVSLTNKEFELLLFLAENPNIVFSKEKLYDRIWGMDSFGDTSTVPVHIKRIREKIGDNITNPQYIETVWGAGYRFRV